MTYEAVDEAGNFAEPKVRTIEIQASGRVGRDASAGGVHVLGHLLAYGHAI